jgi:dihydroflavonol-4-reductase
MTASIFVTGAAGFIGSRVARLLRERGDDVVAVVRDPDSATALRDLGVRLVAGDLGSEDAIRAAMSGSDAAIHIAGIYRIGIPASERPAMYEANVEVTRRVLDAAVAEALPRTVYISTVNVFGNTRGRVVDETFRPDPADGFLSYYQETKYLAHLAAEARIAAGAPILIVLPGTVYGANDHSGPGAQLKAAFDGTAHFVALGGLGITTTYVDDLAAGIVAALDRGRIGESYVMCGDKMRLREAMEIAARVAGRRLPRLSVPDSLLRMGVRLAPNGGAMLGLAPNLAEIASAAVGVTYWASHAKATAELGYKSRDLAIGVRDAFARA